jgi:hypothetical protein
MVRDQNRRINPAESRAKSSRLVLSLSVRSSRKPKATGSAGACFIEWRPLLTLVTSPACSKTPTADRRARTELAAYITVTNAAPPDRARSTRRLDRDLRLRACAERPPVRFPRRFAAIVSVTASAPEASPTCGSRFGSMDGILAKDRCSTRSPQAGKDVHPWSVNRERSQFASHHRPTSQEIQPAFCGVQAGSRARSQSPSGPLPPAVVLRAHRYRPRRYPCVRTLIARGRPHAATVWGGLCLANC